MCIAVAVELTLLKLGLDPRNRGKLGPFTRRPTAGTTATAAPAAALTSDL